MKRFFTLGKTIMLATVLFAGLSFTSCGDDKDDPEPEKTPVENPDDKDKDKDKDKEPEQQPENKDPEKEPEIDPSKIEGEIMLQVDYTKTEWSNWSGFAEGLSGDGDENGLVVTVTQEDVDNPKNRQENGDAAPWFNQYLVLDHFDATKVLPGKTYRIYLDMEAEAAGTIRGSFGSWNHSCGFPDIAFEAGRKSYVVEFKDSESKIGPNDDGGDIHLQFLSGDFIGSYKIYNVAVTKM